MTEHSPVWGQIIARGAEQQYQLGAVHAVPHKGGQQEEVKKSCHRRARSRVWLHLLLQARDGVGLSVAIHCGVILSGGVSGSREEGDDEG